MAGDTPAVEVIDVTINDSWAPEQQWAIQVAVAFWNSELDPGRTVLHARTGPCRIGQRGCISPVPFDHHLLREYDDPDDPSTVVGHCYFRTIVIWGALTSSDLELLAAHELGHFLGLEHEDEGIMAPNSGDMRFEITEADAIFLATLPR